MDETNKNKLIELLNKKIPTFIYSQKNKELVEKAFVNKGFVSTRGMRIFDMSSLLTTVSDVELYMAIN